MRTSPFLGSNLHQNCIQHDQRTGILGPSTLFEKPENWASHLGLLLPWLIYQKKNFDPSFPDSSLLQNLPGGGGTAESGIQCYIHTLPFTPFPGKEKTSKDRHFRMHLSLKFWCLCFLCVRMAQVPRVNSNETLSAPQDGNPELTLWGSFALLEGVGHGHTVEETTGCQGYQVLLKRIPSPSVPLPPPHLHIPLESPH